MMHRVRRARDYTLRTHLIERLLERAGGDGWMAELAYRAGWQPPVVTDAAHLRLPAPRGRFAVLGNHDLWADDHPIVRRLTAAGASG